MMYELKRGGGKGIGTGGVGGGEGGGGRGRGGGGGGRGYEPVVPAEANVRAAVILMVWDAEMPVRLTAVGATRLVALLISLICAVAVYQQRVLVVVEDGDAKDV